MCLLLVNFGLKEFLDNRQLEGKVAFQIIILIGNSVSFLCASTAKKNANKEAFSKTMVWLA